MGKIIIQEETTKKPITLIGKEAGICYNSDVTNEEKNYQRGLDCLSSQHGRTLEFPDIYIIIEGYSARVIRELYTHIGGLPTRLQASTRYINYQKGFEYIIPPSIDKNANAKIIYKTVMNFIQWGLRALEKLGIPKEDSANLLPLGMETKIVAKYNLRTLIDMSHQRKCLRAYWEYRKLFKDLEEALSEYSDEWKIIVENYFVPKCTYLKYCPEKNKCTKN